MTDAPRPPAAPSPPPSSTSSSVRRLPELTRTAMWTTAAVIAVLTAAAVVALWWPATAGLNGPDLVKARFDALKIGLSVGVGSGGVVALYLAWRRQHSTEADLDNRERALAHQQDVAAKTLAQQQKTAEENRFDAAERRITDLYTKAADQLGSDKAAVRLAGLYALERLAQNTPEQRETIGNVLCAYLRMPFQPPVDLPEDADQDTRDRHDTRTQEQAIRQTALDILTRHTSTTGPSHWPEITINLRRANLVGVKLRDVDLKTANLGGADLRGADLLKANLIEADLTGADLRSAALGLADLRAANLRGADLRGTFLRETDLRGADLREADLSGAYLHDANLSGADLRVADLSGARLHGVNLLEANLALGSRDEAKLDAETATQLAADHANPTSAHHTKPSELDG